MQSVPYERLLASASPGEKVELKELFGRQTEIQKEIIETNIRNDRSHLTILNFCINPFYSGASISSKTGYLFIRVEPLYTLQVKNFDMAIYSKKSKNLILVECKSSISDEKGDVKDILEKINVADDNHALLENVVGDKITAKEYVLCSSASVIHKIKPVVVSKNAPICLWSADIFKKKLFLEKVKEETTSEIKSGRLHKDALLRGLLIGGASVIGSVPTVVFLPSSHMCTILTEVCFRLRLHMEREGIERAHFSDVQRVIMKECALANFSQDEIISLTRKVVEQAQKIKVFTDRTPATPDITQKEFDVLKRKSLGWIIKAVRQEYINLKAREKSGKKAVEEFLKGRPPIEKFIK